MQVAQTILQQLGGNRFVVMTGARNILGGDNYLSLRIPGTLTRDGINHVRVELDPSGTYTVTFSKVRGMTVRVVRQDSTIYADQLQELFTSVTGLDTRL